MVVRFFNMKLPTGEAFAVSFECHNNTTVMDLQKHLADFHAVATRVCAERMKLALDGELLKTETRIRDVQDLKDYDVLELHLEMCNTDSVTSSKIFVYDQFCTIDPPHDSKNVPVNTKPTITFNNYLGWEIFAGDMISCSRNLDPDEPAQMTNRYAYLLKMKGTHKMSELVEVSKNSIDNHSRKLNAIPSATHSDMWPYLQLANATEITLSIVRGESEVAVDILSPSAMIENSKDQFSDEDEDDFDDYYDKMLEPPPDVPLDVHPDMDMKQKRQPLVKLVLHPNTVLKSNCTYAILLLKGVPLSPTHLMEDDFMKFIESNYIAVDHISLFTTKAFL